MPAKESPFWVNCLLSLLQLWFYVYDIITYIPIQLLVRPRARVARSNRTKAVSVPSADNNQIVWQEDDGKWHVMYRNVDESKREQIFSHIPAYQLHTKRIEALFYRAVAEYGDRNCMGRRPIKEINYEQGKDGRRFEKLTLGDYRWMSYKAAATSVKHIRNGLMSLHNPNASGSPQPLVLYAETRLEWMLVCLAAFDADIPVATVYATLGEDAIVHAINEVGAATLVTTQELLPTVAKLIGRCQTLKRVIYMERFEPEHIPPSADLFDSVSYELWPLADVLARGEQMRDMVPDKHEGDEAVALIMYTSGTTGSPKGVMITHKNLAAATQCQATGIPELGYRDDDVFCAFLPLAHILEVDCEIACLLHGVPIGYSSPLTLTSNSSKIAKGQKGDADVLKPTLLPVVPAIMDRIYKNITAEMEAAGPLLAGIMRMCIDRRKTRMRAGYDDPFLNRIAFARLRRLLGGRVRIMLSGGAPLNEQTQLFISTCFCCPVLQGYGLTETCGAATLSDVCDLSPGHVGPPLLNCRIILREWSEGGYSPEDDPASGEILVGGSVVACGYWKNPQKTREEFAFIRGMRWFCTGDIGQLQPDDRKKDLVKLNHGEYISLARIETVLKTHPLADNICLYADSLQDYAIALVVPNEKQLRALAAEISLNKDASWEELCSSRSLANKVCEVLNEHGKKNRLSKIELPGRVLLCAAVWTADNNMLTEAMKLKRRPIAQRYKSDIEKLYDHKIAA